MSSGMALRERPGAAANVPAPRATTARPAVEQVRFARSLRTVRKISVPAFSLVLQHAGREPLNGGVL